jgi:glycosyltransferase involved in cell wall biosynthesis
MDYRVSVAMCTFNGSKFIKEQLKSIINQTRQPDEIIICDDISTDNTIKLIESILEETNIKWSVLVNESRLGVVKNFEKAISLCTGDVIFTSDQDDYWVEYKIDKVLDEFKKKPEVNLVFSNARLVDSNLIELPGDLWSSIGFSNNKLAKDKIFVLELLLKNNFVTGATMAFRREVLSEIFPIPYYWIHDYWIAVQCLINGAISGISEKLILYRQHGENVIGAKKLSLTDKTKKYLDNFNYVDEIHSKRLKMSRELIYYLENGNKEIDENVLKIIEVCGKFWERRANQLTKSKTLALREIINDIKNSNYKNYYTGFRGAIRDILVVISVRNRK